MKGYFEGMGRFIYTPGVLEIPDILKLKILMEVIKLEYIKDYFQILSLKKVDNFKLELTIRQENVNDTIKEEKRIKEIEVSEELYNHIDDYEKIYLIEDVYSEDYRVQTMLLPEEY